ncbi:MAG: hypothetical protein HY898_29055 [Deltaproteobacteria bacterium]|nr:hypothetical protein [Deltaproteobacteria bacterium]
MWNRRATCWLLLVGSMAACGSDEQASPAGTGGTGGAGGSGGPTTSSISQNGVTWTFDRPYEYGTYANGDFWVKGPVVITSITPAVTAKLENLGAGICAGGYTSRDCTDACAAKFPDMAALCSVSQEPDSQGDCLCMSGRNGWQVNPAAGRVTSAFDSRVGSMAFDSRLIPALPYTAKPGESLVKGVSREEGLTDNRPSLKTATVLTVVGETPPDAGATVFRPPYVGADKPHYKVSALKTDLLPSLPAVADMPSWKEVEDLVRLVQLEHIAGAPGSIIRPQDHLYYYAPENGGRRATVALRLMIDEPMQNRMPALIYYVQGGIDMLYALKNGQVWGAGGGEYPGMKLIMLFAGVMLGEQGLVDLVRGFTAYEDESVFFGKSQQGLWGHVNGYHEQQEAYWSDVVNEIIPGKEPSRKTNRDPYGYIDGGIVPGTGYQICCSIQSFKGTSLVMQLMPQLKQLWELPALHDYVDRMVEHGALAQPDPCAPPDKADIAAGIGIDDPGTHYGITYGPDGNGGCIPDTDPSDGTGRFPELDGTEKDPRSYHGSSALVHAMWAAYRASAGK